jgi:hypothetical protein
MAAVKRNCGIQGLKQTDKFLKNFDSKYSNADLLSKLGKK